MKVIESIPTRSIGSSTQSLTQHLTNQHGIVLEKGEPPQKQRKITYATVSKEEKKTLDLYVFRWLTAQHLPYSYVNHDKMKEMMSALRPGYVLPAVETLKSILTSSLTSMTNVIKTYLKEQCVGATLSADGWTATNGDPYFGIFLHLLDQEGNPQSILLNASPKEGAQTANALAQHVRCVLDAWGLSDEFQKPLNERKIRWFTSDTTAVMPAMVSLLGYVWIPCVGHLLNLTVQRALKDDEQLRIILKKHRKICGTFRKSPAKRNIFRHAQLDHGLRELTLQGDVKTRWNSTLTMVERNVMNKVAILEVYPLLEENALEPKSKQEQKEWKRRLTMREWELSQQLIEILLPFRLATKAFETEKHPTLSLTIPIYQHLVDELERVRPLEGAPLRSVWDILFSEMNRRLVPIINGSEDYWCAVFFDPRTKNVTKDSPYYSMLVRTCEAKFVAKFGPSLPPPPLQPSPAPTFLDQLLKTSNLPEEKTEFQRYLEVSSCSSQQHPAEWFEKKGLKQMFYLYRVYCCAPGASTSIERLWSESGFLIDRRRSRLSGEVVNERLQWKKNSKFLESIQSQ